MNRHDLRAAQRRQARAQRRRESVSGAALGCLHCGSRTVAVTELLEDEGIWEGVLRHRVGCPALDGGDEQ